MADKVFVESGRNNRNTQTRATANSGVNRAGARTAAGSGAGTGRSSDDRRLERDREDEKSTAAKKAIDEEVEANARKLLKRKELIRKIVIASLAVIVLVSIAFMVKTALDTKSADISAEMLSKVKERENNNPDGTPADDQPEIHYTEEGEPKEVLPEYKDLLNINKNLIGWIKIADILPEEGLPVMQLPADNPNGNTWYLEHDISGKENKNGTLFMDNRCDAMKPGMNLIIYGHHMRSGAMFGNLEKYDSEDVWSKHKAFTFDTIYDHGTYQVMYVFRTAVKKQGDITYKYYDFTGDVTPSEFESYMNEMAEMSLYDTGVTASYGDHLIMLSTCDYEEANGRFVVVGKKIR